MITGAPRKLCRIEEIADPGAREFEITLDGEKLEIFVVHWHGDWYAYKNHCPHTGVNLNWLPDQFFDIEHRFIQCSTHGALFTPESGHCVRGPCAGESLQQLECVVNNGIVYVQG